MEMLATSTSNYKINLAIAIPIVLCSLISLSGLIGIAGLIYVAITLIFILLLPFDVILCIVPINIVYFTYSYIDVSMVAGWSNVDYINVCNLLFVVRILIETFRQRRFFIKVSGNRFELYIIILLMAYFSVLQTEVSIKSFAYQVCMFVTVFYVLRLIRNDESIGYSFTVQFFIVLMSVYVYNFLQIGRYSTAHYYWVANRFVGVRDPNNFALQSNICMLFALRFLKTKLSTFKLYIILAILSFSSIITLSVSGFGTTLAILTYVLFTDKRSRILKIIFSALTIIVFVMILMGNIQINDSSIIGSIFKRINTIIRALESGDYYSATTTRTVLWEKYINGFSKYSQLKQYTGSPTEMASIGHNIGMSSHNNYIDILLNYGYFGLTIYSLAIVLHLAGNIKKKDYIFAFMNILMVVNLFFRSLSGYISWIGLFI